MDGTSLTYAELNGRANQLAWHLRRLGIGDGSLVAIALERSIDMVVGLLGILKSGAAYLPLDLAYPKDRVSFVLEDAAPAAMLTSASSIDRLPALGRLPALLLDDPAPAWQQEAPENPPATGGADPLAYVIYTSGSTGRPKGCLVTHGNVLQLLIGTEPWFGFGPQDVWSFFHSHAFDFSVWEIWGPWPTVGGWWWCRTSPAALRASS
jgi:non-ribosomal peptide synthetase component F